MYTGDSDYAVLPSDMPREQPSIARQLARKFGYNKTKVAMAMDLTLPLVCFALGGHVLSYMPDPNNSLFPMVSYMMFISAVGYLYYVKTISDLDYAGEDINADDVNLNVAHQPLDLQIRDCETQWADGVFCFLMPLLNIISFALVQWVLLNPTNRFGFTPSPSLGLLTITLTHYLYIFLIKQELHMSLEVAFMIGGIGLLNMGAMTSVIPSFGVTYDDCFYTVVVGFFASLALNV